MLKRGKIPRATLVHRETSPTGHRPSAPVQSRGCPQQLIDGKEQYTGGRIAKVLKENTDFFVIGILGGQGLGKSSLLNHVLGFPGGGVSAFKVSEGAAVMQHCTVGIKFQINPDRLIGLDSQAVGLASVLLQLMQAKADVPPGIIPAGSQLSAAAQQQQQDLRRAVFLLNVCHLVVVMSEGVEDTDSWELLLTAEMLAHGIQDLSLPGENHSLPLQEHLAEVMFVHSKVRADDSQEWSVQLLQQALDAYFAGSQLQRKRLGQHKSLHFEGETAGIRLFVLPEVGKVDDSPDLQDHLRELSHVVLATPKAKFARPLTEQAWLYGCENVWSQIKASQEIEEYVAHLL